MVSLSVVLQQGKHILDSIFGREQRDQLDLLYYELETAWTGHRKEIQATRKKYSIIFNSKLILKSVKIKYLWSYLSLILDSTSLFPT